MYSRIGEKIKNLAKASVIVEAIAAVITGIVLVLDDWNIIFVLLVIFVGPFLAWVFSWLIYGFGELIDKTCDIEHNTRSSERKSESQEHADEEKINKIERLRSQGLITEEEYQKAISKSE